MTTTHEVHLTVPQFAKMLGTSTYQVRKAVTAGELKVVQTYRGTLIPESELTRFQAERCREVPKLNPHDAAIVDEMIAEAQVDPNELAESLAKATGALSVTVGYIKDGVKYEAGEFTREPADTRYFTRDEVVALLTEDDDALDADWVTAHLTLTGQRYSQMQVEFIGQALSLLGEDGDEGWTLHHNGLTTHEA
jgi:integrase